MIRTLILCCLALGLAAEMKTMEVRYERLGKTYSGTLTWSDATDAKRPLVLMVPNWMGPTPDSLEKAQLLAGERYVVFMADVYGVDVRPTNSEEAGAAAGALRGDRPELRLRAQHAIDQAIAKAGPAPIDTGVKVGAIGFCFGGGTVLELARAGADIAGAVSFHGNLDTPNPADAANVRTSLLVLHGAADPFVPPAQVDGFKAEMDAAEVDYELVAFEGAVHSFTNPKAAMPGKAEYHAEAAARSFELMHAFLAERFAAP